MEHHNGSAIGRTVLMMVELNRSDRLAALAQDPQTLQVLTEVARRVEAMLRPGDRYSFVSHDEIWLLLCDLPSETLAELAGRTLRESLLRPIVTSGDESDSARVILLPVVGGAWTRSGLLAEAQTLVREASSACERARRSRENVLISVLDSDVALVERSSIEREVRQALHGNELDVYFQPQIDLANGRCVAVEALIRWKRDDGLAVSPSLIASICEEHGLMDELTQYVLNTSLRQASFWKMQGIDVSVAINLSALTLSDTVFPSVVTQALATWGVAPESLTLELTETAIVQNEANAVALMTRLDELGCQLALDDFGTGYSSFTYLKQFPLTELKIDQSFVHNVTKVHTDRRIVQALIDLAHTFGMRALAEGVEREAVLAELIALG